MAIGAQGTRESQCGGAGTGDTENSARTFSERGEDTHTHSEAVRACGGLIVLSLRVSHSPSPSPLCFCVSTPVSISAKPTSLAKRPTQRNSSADSTQTKSKDDRRGEPADITALAAQSQPRFTCAATLLPHSSIHLGDLSPSLPKRLRATRSWEPSASQAVAAPLPRLSASLIVLLALLVSLLIQRSLHIVPSRNPPPRIIDVPTQQSPRRSTHRRFAAIPSDSSQLGCAPQATHAADRGNGARHGGRQAHSSRAHRIRVDGEHTT